MRWIGFLALCAACAGTETTNPFDGEDSSVMAMDAGHVGFDSGTSLDASAEDSGQPPLDVGPALDAATDAGAGQDAGFMCGDAGSPPESCTTTASEDCDCLAEPPTTAITEETGIGQGPKALLENASGSVLVHQKTCLEGCTGTALVQLVQLDSGNTPSGDPVVLSDSVVTHVDATAIGDDVFVAWADDRASPTALYGARSALSDLGSVQSPAQITAPPAPVSDLAIAANDTEVALAYVAATNPSDPLERDAVRVLRPSQTGMTTPVSGVTVRDVDIAPLGDAWALLYADDDNAHLVVLDDEGERTASHEIGTASLVIAVHLATLGDGLVAGWGGTQVQLRRIDSSGAAVGDVVTLGPGTLSALSPDGDGVMAAWLDAPFCTTGAMARFSRLDSMLERRHRDVSVGEASFTMAITGEGPYHIATHDPLHASGSVVLITELCGISE